LATTRSTATTARERRHRELGTPVPSVRSATATTTTSAMATSAASTSRSSGAATSAMATDIATAAIGDQHRNRGELGTPAPPPPTSIRRSSIRS